MTRSYFRTINKLKRKSISRTRRIQEQSRLEKEKYLNSPEGKAAIARIQDADAVSTVMQLKGMVK